MNEAIPPPLAPPDDDTDEGAIPRTLRRIFGKSWKTSAIALLGIGVSIIPLVPGAPAAWVDFAHAAQPFIASGGLLFAKDHDKSGGKK